MKNLITATCFLCLCSCASEPLKPESVQTKIGLGMSVADVISTVGLPKEKKSTDGTMTELVYEGYVLSFSDKKLSSGRLATQSTEVAMNLRPITEQKPDYQPDSWVLNKDMKSMVSAYHVSSYLDDETLFEKAVLAGVPRDGFTLKSNALCVALTEGFLKGTAAVLKAGYDETIQLRSDKGVYIFPEACIGLQKDTAVAAELKKMLADNKLAEAQKTPEEKKAATEEKSLINWQAVKDFLKPVPPTPPAKSGTAN